MTNLTISVSAVRDPESKAHVRIVIERPSTIILFGHYLYHHHFVNSLCMCRETKSDYQYKVSHVN